MKYQIINGNNINVLKTFPDNHFDSIVTDPPYGIDFLGKSWDANTGALETYQECLRVLKPGGHILAFSAARTYHHLAITLEQAGFEIRDQIMWIYSSGFPKSQDIGRQLHKKEHGKPDKQRFDKNEMLPVKTEQPPNGMSRMTFNQEEPAKLKDTGLWKHKLTGKVYRMLPDINGDRLEKSHEGQGYGVIYEEVIEVDNPWTGWGTALKPAHEPIALARKPIKTSIRDNVVKYGTGAINIDATRIPTDDKMIGGVGTKNTYENFSAENIDKIYDDITIWNPAEGGRFPSNVLGEIPDYQKYFYCPKVSRKERHIGFDEIEQGNNHPTVKPIELMKYLIKLVTPQEGRILDPFNGSGSTGCAAVELGFEYVGIELDAKYVEIATKRIEAWNKDDTAFKEIFE